MKFKHMLQKLGFKLLIAGTTFVPVYLHVRKHHITKKNPENWKEPVFFIQYGNINIHLLKKWQFFPQNQLLADNPLL